MKINIQNIFRALKRAILGILSWRFGKRVADPVEDLLKGYGEVRRPEFPISVIVANVGKGQCAFLSQYAKLYQDKTRGMKTPRKVLICDPSRSRSFDSFPKVTLEQIRHGIVGQGRKQTQPWRSGIMVLRDVKWTNPEWFEVLNSHFKNGLIIFGDADIYLPSIRELYKEQFDCFNSREDNCVDIAISVREYRFINKAILEKARYYYCFEHLEVSGTPDKEWFRKRALPEELYDVSKMLSSIVCDDCVRIKPMVILDTVTKGKQFIVHPESEQYLQVRVPGKNGEKLLMPYIAFKNAK